MFDLTVEEKKIILFLVFATLSGLGISYAAKSHAGFQEAMEDGLKIAKLNLNQAGKEDILDAGFPEKLAASIAEYKSRQGSFDSLEQLKEIKGIKEKRFKQLEKVFFVE